MKGFQGLGCDLSQTIKTDQTLHTLESEKNEKLKIEENLTNEEIIEDYLPTIDEKPEIKEKKPSQNGSVKDKYSAPVSPNKIASQIVPSQEPKFDWLPPGPWCIDGKLDPNFRDAIAKDWIIRYGGDLHQRRADVLAHFKKDPANLPIRWEQYASEWLHRYENTQTRMQHGIEIEPDYQQRLIDNHRAVTEPLPPELDPIAQKPTIISLPPAQVKAIPAAPPPSNGTRPDNGENAQAYQIWTAPPEPDEEAIKQTKNLISDFLSKMGRGMRKSTAKPPTTLERLNNWINDPLLQGDALKEVMQSDAYLVEFDSNGNPYQVIRKEIDDD